MDELSEAVLPGKEFLIFDFRLGGQAARVTQADRNGAVGPSTKTRRSNSSSALPYKRVWQKSRYSGHPAAARNRFAQPETLSLWL
jgi:hypothetical protein